MARTMTGGRQCGSVRYRVTVDVDEAIFCHCRMCQRATGGVFAVLKQVPRAAVTWTTREPDRRASWQTAACGFCAECGSPLTYDGRGSEKLDLTEKRTENLPNIVSKWMETRGKLPD